MLFVLTVYNSEFHFVAKILLTTFGVGVFLHSTWSLYTSNGGKNFSRISNVRTIRRIFLLDKSGGIVTSWELYGKVSMVIGKDIGENFVDIDLSQSPYAAMADVEHAVLNYAEGNWYIEDLESKNGVSVRKSGQSKAYKLSGTEPCKLDFGDIILIGNCQLKVAD